MLLNVLNVLKWIQNYIAARQINLNNETVLDKKYEKWFSILLEFLGVFIVFTAISSKLRAIGYKLQFIYFVISFHVFVLLNGNWKFNFYYSWEFRMLQQKVLKAFIWIY